MAAEHSVVGWLKRVFGAPASAPAPTEATPQPPAAAADVSAPRRSQERRDERPTRRNSESRGGDGSQGSGGEGRGERNRRGGSGRGRSRSETTEAGGTQPSGPMLRDSTDAGRDFSRPGDDTRAPRSSAGTESEEGARESSGRADRGDSARGSRNGERRGSRGGNNGTAQRPEAAAFDPAAADGAAETPPMPIGDVGVEPSSDQTGEARAEGTSRPRRERGGRGGARRGERGDRPERSEQGDRNLDAAGSEGQDNGRATSDADRPAMRGGNDADASVTSDMQAGDRQYEASDDGDRQPVARAAGQDDGTSGANDAASEPRRDRRNSEQRPGRDRRPRGERNAPVHSDAPVVLPGQVVADDETASDSRAASNAAGATAEMASDPAMQPPVAAETPSLLIAAAEVSTVASSNLHDSEAVAIESATTPAEDSASGRTAELPKAGAFALPIDQLAGVAEGAGLQWVQSDADRVRSVQQAIAAEAMPSRQPRERAPVAVPDDGALVLVETRKAVPDLQLPQQ